MHTSRLLRPLRTWASVVLTVGLASLLWPASLGGEVGYVMVSGESMEPGLHTGDLVLVRDTGDYGVGDVVAYRVPAGEVGAGSVVIHRIVGGDDDGWVTQGDNRDETDLWHPAGSDVVGELFVGVPRLGVLVARLRNPASLGVLAAMGAFVAVVMPARRRPRPAAAASQPV